MHDKPKKATPATGEKRRPGRPPIEGPTSRQLEILDFIRSVSQTGRRPPTIDEIRRHLKFQSTFSVRTHLRALEKKGILQIARNSHRGISIPDGDKAVRCESRRVPLLGNAAAGNPIEAIEVADEHVGVDPGMFPENDLFAIRVRGDSMVDAGINDHDVALIRPGSEAADGALVLAMLNGEVTVKRLRIGRGEPYLHPENSKYPDIHVRDGDDFSIIGTVAGIVRKY